MFTHRDTRRFTKIHLFSILNHPARFDEQSVNVFSRFFFGFHIFFYLW